MATSVQALHTWWCHLAWAGVGHPSLTWHLLARLTRFEHNVEEFTLFKRLFPIRRVVPALITFHCFENTLIISGPFNYVC